MRRYQRLGWAALASLVIHAALLLLIWEEAPPAIPMAPPSRPDPLAVEIITLPRPTPPDTPAPAREAPPAKSSPGKKTPTEKPRPRPEPPLVDREPPVSEPPTSEQEETPSGVATAPKAPPSEAMAVKEPVAEAPPAPATSPPAVPPEEAAPVEPPVAEAPSAPEATPSTAPGDASPPSIAGTPSDLEAPPSAEPQQGSSAVAEGPTSDSPRARTGGFYPLPPSLVPGGAPSGGPKTQSGHTLRPGDPSLSPEYLAAQERARVSGRVETFIEDKQADLRVANGLIDPYFSRLREALEKSMADAPVFSGTSLLDNATQSWGSQASRFGATGNPGTGPVPMAPTVSEQLAGLNQQISEKGMEKALEALRLKVQAGEEMQKLAGGGGEKLVVTLELHQGPDGSLRDVKLVSLSGNTSYDAYVLNAVPPALAKLTPPPDQARGVRPEGIHTLWSVEGRVVYLRKLKDVKGEDAWYMAAAAAAGVLAGRFEETTGELEIIDFRNPRFVCQPRLLRVY
ncbi:TonB C-terminal domain-containing protein [Pyxidicoccus sp. 3LG]